MRKVYMRRNNDCQTAAYATVLGLAYEEVPLFYDENDIEIDNWQKVNDDFLAKLGLQNIHISYSELALSQLKGYLIVGIKSYNPKYKDSFHAVIFKDGVLWHDPNPDVPEGVVIEPVSINLFAPIFDGGQIVKQAPENEVHKQLRGFLTKRHQGMVMGILRSFNLLFDPRRN